MNFQSLPEELIVLFFSYARTIIELLNFSLINKQSLSIVRREKWPLIQISIYPDNFDTIATNFNFSNICMNDQLEYVKQTRNEQFIKNVQHLDVKSCDVNDMPLYPNLKTLVIKNTPLSGIYIDFSKYLYLKSLSIYYTGIDKGSLRTIKNCKSLNFTSSFSHLDDIIDVLKLNPSCEKLVFEPGHGWGSVNYTNLYPYLMNMTSITIDMLCDQIPCFPKCRKLVIDTECITLDILKQMIDASLEAITLTYNKVPIEWFEHLGKLKVVKIYSKANWMYDESSLMMLKNCESIGLNCNSMTNNVLKSFSCIKKLKLQNYGGLNLQLIPSTIEKLSISRYDFDCEWIHLWQHLIHLKIYNSIVSNDITLLKQLHKLYFEDTAVDRCDIMTLRMLGVDAYGSYAMDSEDCEPDSLDV
jgi:hypothetical protein